VTGDGRDDLAINVEGENVTGVTGAEGCVYLLKGSAGGVSTAGITVACVSSVNTGGHFNSVAIGRFHGGSNADLIVYADQIRGGPNQSGVLAVFRGTSTGLSSPANLTFLSQDSASVSDAAEVGDKFGAALAIGDIDADGADDLAVGVPGEDTGGGSGQGAVQVFLGGSSGLTSALDLFFTENHPLINATGQFTEGFGSAVRLLDITNDGRPELVVTAPFEDFSYNTGTTFVLGLARTSTSVALTSNTTLTRSTLGGTSAYGTAFPVANGIIPPTDLPNVP